VSRCGSGSWEGWPRILERLKAFAAPEKCTISLECYPGVLEKALIGTVVEGLRPPGLIVTSDLLKSPSEIELMVSSVLGDDPVFGRMNGLRIEDFFDNAKLASAREQVKNWKRGLLVIVGVGASLFSAEPNLLVYADMARWEIQQRQRRNVIGNLGADNLQESPGQKYKRAFFVDWRAADHLKKSLLEKIDFWLDTNGDIPKLVTGHAVRDGLKQIAHRPFRVVPYFDPGPWGGHWMEEVCGLPTGMPNYAWCFDCVPEENSLLLNFGGTRVEIPAMSYWATRCFHDLAPSFRFVSIFSTRWEGETFRYRFTRKPNSSVSTSACNTHRTRATICSMPATMPACISVLRLISTERR
jgi:hypothetical protein